MSPSDREDDLEQLRPSNRRPSSGDSPVPGYERYAGRTPTVQRRIDRRREAAAEGGARIPSVDARRGEAERKRPGRDRNSRLVAAAVLLVVAVVFAIAGAAGASGSDSDIDNAATVPFSVLPLTPEYLKEGAATSTTAYPDSAMDEGDSGGRMNGAAGASSEGGTGSEDAATSTGDGG